ncbi:hypothetical protein CR194_08840 [Salipaludibacillus keqinensis]|uniref:Uncharacterized protein n=1 Tax=Salipaludibacillus keqinensis TaxID=2045207 RepID=A0A323TFG0_9BACI|nr:UPF0223 family protein [Salipaludibacillus keqinensis]PYZ93290.1 hypothetical protein CR194_08840 [Salipaludibacillus keqinensis]
MKNDINIPITMDWTKEEIVDVVHFYEAIDQAYGKGVDRDLLLKRYQQFKKIVPSKSEEKQHFKDYQEQTTQSPYHVVKEARESQHSKKIKMSSR